MRQLRKIYWIVLIALTLAAAGKGIAQDLGQVYLTWVALLFAVGAVLGALTFMVAKLPMIVPMRGLLVVVLGYHALFGPIMLAYKLTTTASRNEDFPLQLYPHVIYMIDSLE